MEVPEEIFAAEQTDVYWPEARAQLDIEAGDCCGERLIGLVVAGDSGCGDDSPLGAVAKVEAKELGPFFREARRIGSAVWYRLERIATAAVK